MNARPAGSGAIAANFSLLYDPRVGIIAELAETARETGAPDFIHYRASTCFTRPVGGVSGRFAATAAAPIREEAAARAVERRSLATPPPSTTATPYSLPAQANPNSLRSRPRFHHLQPEPARTARVPLCSLRFRHPRPLGERHRPGQGRIPPRARRPSSGTLMPISVAAVICPSRRQPPPVSPVARASRRRRSPG